MAYPNAVRNVTQRFIEVRYLLEKEMVSNIVNLLRDKGVRVHTEQQDWCETGFIDILIDPNRTIIEVKKDASDLHRALGQLLAYTNLDWAMFHNQKRILVCGEAIPEKWYFIFKHYKIDVVYYSSIFREDFDLAELGVRQQSKVISK